MRMGHVSAWRNELKRGVRGNSQKRSNNWWEKSLTPRFWEKILRNLLNAKFWRIWHQVQHKMQILSKNQLIITRSREMSSWKQVVTKTTITKSLLINIKSTTWSSTLSNTKHATASFSPMLASFFLNNQCITTYRYKLRGIEK